MRYTPRLQIFVFCFGLANLLLIPFSHCEPEDIETQQLSDFYKTKDQRVLEAVIAKFPRNRTARKEMGYLLLREKKYEEASQHFIAAYDMDETDFALAMQIGYVSDQLGRKREAISYFQKANESNDQSIKDKSYEALVNSREDSLQFLPNPLFADLYAAPFYYSRFSFAEIPARLRFGAAFGDGHLFEIYSNFSVVKDSLSSGGTLNVAPSIIDDNYLLLGGGARLNLDAFIKFMSITIYGEVGAALDIVSQNRDPWRADYRAGVILSKDWSAVPQFSETFQFKFTHVGDLYSDISYFSRYQNDVIGYARFREGVRFLQFKDTSLEAYARLFLILDSNLYFFNDLVEIGPGVALIPNNKWPIALRYEPRFGFYINLNGPLQNPYDFWYVTHMLLLELNYRF